ncbi:MAG: hypothetical protein M0Z66_10860 [Thermaerobacter sp.]|nr:hypothetical protein [Thermaerobacter sp.]
MDEQHRLIEFLCAGCGAQGLTQSQRVVQPIQEIRCPTCGHPLHLLAVTDHHEPIAV